MPVDGRLLPASSGQIFDDQLDYWKPIDPDNGNWNPVNPDAEYFRIYNQRENSGSNTRAQTKYLLNGAYLRVKTSHSVIHSRKHGWMLFT